MRSRTHRTAGTRSQSIPGAICRAALIGSLVISFFPTGATAQDLPTEQVTYVVSNAHMDTQWKWSMQWTIDQFLPNTLRSNFRLLERYPDYKFNFEGAFRYILAKDYYPGAYDTLRTYVEEGRWCLAGGMVDACDVNIPSSEALIRQFLYGNGFFEEEFGKRSHDIFLPDCFGFGYTLPTIGAHCGIIGFSTQKLGWEPGWMEDPRPFPLGVWEGVDGSTLFAALAPGGYSGPYEIRTGDGEALQDACGVWATYDYMGVGDTGGAPNENDVSALMNRIAQNGSNAIKVYNTPSDQMFHDLAALPQATIDAMPHHKGELVKTLHGVGCYTSRADIKLLNWRNEHLGVSAEAACVAASVAANRPYPTRALRDSWFRFLKHQFHDDLTGTSIAEAYTDFTIPAEDSSIAEFTSQMTSANSAVASEMDTRVSHAGAVALVVFNPLSLDRRDIVESAVSFGGTTPADVAVYDAAGNECPSQVLGASGSTVTFLFVASVPSIGYSVYEVEPLTSVKTYVSPVSATSSTLSNACYDVTIDANGDLSSIQDKATGRDLLSAPSRFELRDNSPGGFAAWEIRWEDMSPAPRSVVGGPAEVEVVENGPVRASVRVRRTHEGSTFTQWYRLSADSAGSHVEVVNEIDWNTGGTLLKASFPLTASDSVATYDLGIGVIQRPNMNPRLYEVPGHQWADITDGGRAYGTAILNEYKRGWDKYNDNTLHLTLIHSPSDGGDYDGDLFVHRFRYGIAGHAGDWRTGKVVWQGLRFNAPLVASVEDAHDGVLGKRFSLLSTDPSRVAVMACKKGEWSDKLIVRVREIAGGSAQGVPLTFAGNVTGAEEVNGMEDESGRSVAHSGSRVSFGITEYQPKTFAVTLDGVNSVDFRKPPAARTGAWYVSVRVAGAVSSTTFVVEEEVGCVAIVDCAGRTVFRREFADPLAGRNLAIDPQRPLPAGIYALRLGTNRGWYTSLVKIGT